MSWLTAYITIAWALRLAMVPVILRRDFAPGASVAWLGIIFLHPYIGAGLYLLVGETRLGRQRTAWHRELMQRYRAGSRPQTGTDQDPGGNRPAGYDPMIRQTEKISGMPLVSGNTVEFLGSTPVMIDRLVSDIDAAQSHVHLLYFIFANDATGHRVTEALARAAGRGVHCRVLMDALGSRKAFHPRGLATRLRRAGVEVAAALPVAPIRRRLPRMDLRNHRKLTVIDGRLGYTGSHNLINPDYAGRRGGPWIDLSARFAGPVVRQLSTVFAEDWAFETGQLLEIPPLPIADCQFSDCQLPIADCRLPAEHGKSEMGNQKSAIGNWQSAMQVVPTGPSAPGETYRRVLLGALQSARSRIVLTTPYFVPDEPTLVALMMAADRGVRVTLILPNRVDHTFAAAAGRAHFTRLLHAGVEIQLYQPALLHAKTVVIDDAFALLGSANLDVRSFNLDFELTVLLYDRQVARRLASLQQEYLADCRPVELAQWEKRPLLRQYADRAVSLVSPLL